jgi:hypothetical protein
MNSPTYPHIPASALPDPVREAEVRRRRLIVAHEARVHEAPGPVVVPPVRDYEHVLVATFEWTAAGYALLAGGISVLAFTPWLGRGFTDSGPGRHAALALIAAALAALAALHYGIPHAQGGKLWSLPLAWFHWLLVNAGFLYPAWIFHAGGTSTEEAWDRLPVVMAVLLAGGLAATVVNLVASMLHSDDAPEITRLGV